MRLRHRRHRRRLLRSLAPASSATSAQMGQDGSMGRMTLRAVLAWVLPRLERDKTFRTLCLAFVRERKKSRVDAQVHAAGVALQPASDFWPCEPCLALPSVPRESNTFAPGATGATGAVWSIQIDAGLCAGLLPGCQSPRPGHRFPHLCVKQAAPGARGAECSCAFLNQPGGVPHAWAR